MNISRFLKLNSAGTVLRSVAVSTTDPLPIADQGVRATFTTLNRPANTTAYDANDSISNHGTAASVTALSATIATNNDAPIAINRISVYTTDTGLGAGVQIRAYIYESNPTSNSGVAAGDNAAFSNKQAGRVATFTGTFIAASDGGVANLFPEGTNAGNSLIVFPASGAKTLWIQYQVIGGGFTPSANSTTLIAKAHGIQLRA